MRGASDARAAREAVWAAIFELYSARPAIGVLGAEVVELALEAEDLIARDLARTEETIPRGARGVIAPEGNPVRNAVSMTLAAYHEGLDGGQENRGTEARRVPTSGRRFLPRSAGEAWGRPRPRLSRRGVASASR